MRLYTFTNHRHYHRIQVKTERRKYQSNHSWSEEEIEQACDWIKARGVGPDNVFGVCHGCRDLGEPDEFTKHFNDPDVIGTDMVHGERDHQRLISWDFHTPNKNWIGKFDFVYTNALDHAHSPFEAVDVWLKQLKPTGFLLIQWCPWHDMQQGGDCFAATLHEYVQMLEMRGQFEDALYCGNSTFTLVASPQDPGWKRSTDVLIREKYLGDECDEEEYDGGV